MAACLPLELQQHIYQYLDPQSFYAARNVSRWWRHASRDSVTFAAQLRQLPIKPLVSAKTLGSRRLESLYKEAARTLMLGMRVTTQDIAGASLSKKIVESKIAISRDGRRAVTLNDRRITLRDLTSSPCKIISQRDINDLRSALGGGPWFKCAPTSVYELSLSSSGNLLAIALDRTVQIYDLEAGEDSWPVSSYISSAAGHYIAGLEFQHNDSLLRVQLSNKGTAVYLGTPQDTFQGLQHWQGKGGIKHAFLDSSKMVPKPMSHTGVPETLAGLQLLQPFQNGWLFAAQKRCATTHSAGYCIGHVAISELDRHVATAEKLAYTLAELPSSMSTTAIPEMVHGIWQDLPSALIQHPQFSLSGDGNLLCMSETMGVPGHSGTFNRVFVFRLPEPCLMGSQLEQVRAADTDEDGHEAKVTISQPGAHDIRRLPLSIGCVNGKILNFDFTQNNCAGTYGRYTLCATTQLGTRTFTLQDS